MKHIREHACPTGGEVWPDGDFRRATTAAMPKHA